MLSEITLEHPQRQGPATKKARKFRLFSMLLIAVMCGVGDLPNGVLQAAFDILLCADLRVRLSLHYQIAFHQLPVRPAGVKPFHIRHRRIQINDKAVIFFLQIVQIAPADTDAALPDTFHRPAPVFILPVFLLYKLPDIVLVIS